MVLCLPLSPRFAGTNLTESGGLLRAIKSVAQLLSEGKKSHRPHFVRFYGMFNIPGGMILQPEQRTLVDETGMIRTHMRSTLYKKILVAALNACTKPPSDSNQ
jgi:hypothetical protein